MATISLCMIVKNEAAVLARCLDSVQAAADEIILVDTGSDDETKEIALRYTEKVYDFAWVNDFSAARNFAYDQASMDYQMWLDADDVLPGDQLEKLLALKATLPEDVDMVTMKYHTHFDAHGAPIFTSTRERLTRRSCNFRWQDPVHECIPLSGKLLHSDIAIWHQKPPQAQPSTRNLDIYTALAASGAALTPRQQYYYARELKDHAQFEQAATYFSAFLDGGHGWVEDNISACLCLAACCDAMGQPQQRLDALFRSFQYGAPRAEACCQIGYCHKDNGRHDLALEWFDLAAHLPQAQSLGFVQADYHGFIPNIEACVCAYELGQYQRAWDYNQRAERAKPGTQAAEINRAVLAPMLQHAPKS